MFDLGEDLLLRQSVSHLALVESAVNVRQFHREGFLRARPPHELHPREPPLLDVVHVLIRVQVLWRVLLLLVQDDVVLETNRHPRNVHLVATHATKKAVALEIDNQGGEETYDRRCDPDFKLACGMPLDWQAESSAERAERGACQGRAFHGPLPSAGRVLIH